MKQFKRNVEAIFLDRDCTIGGDHTIHYPGSFNLFPSSKNLINQLKLDGIKIFSFTNQPGISEGKASIKDFEEELHSFGFDDTFICPHSHNEGCLCRKPGSGMLLQAAKRFNLHLENCVVIGDRWSDLVAASQVNCIKILVKTGAGQSTLNEYYHKIQSLEIEYIAEDLSDAIDWLYKQGKINIA